MGNATETKPVKEKDSTVDMVVQEYMDTLLGDLFPPVEETPAEITNLDLEAPVEQLIEPPVTLPQSKKPNPMDSSLSVQKEPLQQVFKAPAPRTSEFEAPDIDASDPVALTLAVPELTAPELTAPELTVPERKPDPVKVVKQDSSMLKPESASQQTLSIKVQPQISELVKVITPPTILNNAPVADIPQVIAEATFNEEPEVEKRFPKAPAWAQEPFDVLLFDVCGLKLAVPMGSLGKIIKVEHETHQLIGRPDWFIGAYQEGEEHLYVVDTAKYIMPEKGYDLERDGFGYLIQLQRSKWTLACKQVHTTVRVEPDHVKWRSSEGKRQWLSGTIIEHMCALIHVDKLVEILNANA
jgi:purine-binding chemotaxis protein CheW